MAASPIRIEYAGRLALTVAQAAHRHHMAHATMRKILQRMEVEGQIERLPEPIDARTPLYDAEALDAAMKARPGRGANLRRAER